jgi:hypothetical protein
VKDPAAGCALAFGLGLAALGIGLVVHAANAPRLGAGLMMIGLLLFAAGLLVGALGYAAAGAGPIVEPVVRERALPRAFEELRRRLHRGTARRDVDPEEWLVAGRLQGEVVMVRGAGAMPGLRSPDATCSLTAQVPPALTGVLTRAAHGAVWFDARSTKPAAYDDPRARAALDALLLRCPEVRVSLSGLEATTPHTHVDALEEVLTALAALAAVVRRDPVPPPDPRPRVIAVRDGKPAEVHAVERDEGARCPFCRDALDGAIPAVTCDACGTPQHAACFEEHGRCSVHGCGRRRASPVRG